MADAELLAECESIISCYAGRGWQISVEMICGWDTSKERVKEGDFHVTSPRGNRYNLLGLEFLRGDDGHGNFFSKRGDIIEAEGRKDDDFCASALNLGHAVRTYFTHFVLPERSPRLLTHVHYEQS